MLWRTQLFFFLYSLWYACTPCTRMHTHSCHQNWAWKGSITSCFEKTFRQWSWAAVPNRTWLFYEHRSVSGYHAENSSIYSYPILLKVRVLIVSLHSWRTDAPLLRMPLFVVRVHLISWLLAWMMQKFCSWRMLFSEEFEEHLNLRFWHRRKTLGTDLPIL